MVIGWGSDGRPGLNAACRVLTWLQMIERCALHEKLFLAAVLMDLTRTGLTETHMDRVGTWEWKHGGGVDEPPPTLTLSVCLCELPGVAILLALVCRALSAQALS